MKNFRCMHHILSGPLSRMKNNKNHVHKCANIAGRTIAGHKNKQNMEYWFFRVSFFCLLKWTDRIWIASNISFWCCILC